jgi:hypothetical protein
MGTKICSNQKCPNSKSNKFLGCQGLNLCQELSENREEKKLTKTLFDLGFQPLMQELVMLKE